MNEVPEIERQSKLIEQLCEALRLTREYVGEDLLPAIPGWSWYDALVAAGRIVPPPTTEQRIVADFVDQLARSVQPKIESRWYTKATALAVVDQARKLAASFATSSSSAKDADA